MSFIFINANQMVPICHLAFLVLAAIPFSFSGVASKRGHISSSPASLLNAREVYSATTQTVTVFSWPRTTAPRTPIHNQQRDSITVESTTPSTSSLAPSIISESLNSTMIPYPSARNHSNGTVPEIGGQYGRVVIHNNCNETFHIWSVGAWPLRGVRNDTIGYAAIEEQIAHLLAPNASHSEPFRVTCPPTLKNTIGYCHDYDKLRGQGVSLKISRNASLGWDILQFEYALTMNPNNNDTYLKLHYDVSLLDCADPNKVQSVNGTKILTVADPLWRNTTDANASEDDHKEKHERCPGYRSGIKVTFAADPQAKKCQPVDCSGNKVCPQMYYFDRTRKDEPSMSCSAEYKGDMVLDLCAGMKRAENGTNGTIHA